MVLTQPLPHYDFTPEELKLTGTPEHLLTSDEIIRIATHKNLAPHLVTKVVLRYIKMNPTSIQSMVERFTNLRHFEVLGENLKSDKVAYFENMANIADHHHLGPDWYLDPAFNPHPHLKHFTFHQLNYYESLQNHFVLKELMLRNVIFFIPWPHGMGKISENMMHIDIKFGKDLVVNIDPVKNHCYLRGEASSDFISVLVDIPFETVEIKDLSEKSLLGKQDALRRFVKDPQPNAFSLDGLSRTKLRKLVLKNTTVNLFGNGRIFQNLENLEELKYEGEAFRVTSNNRRPFELIFLPKKLKKLELGYVKILPPRELWEGETITLKYLGFFQCYFPPLFEVMLLSYFNVENLSFFDNCKEHRPNFDWLFTLTKMKNLRKLFLCQFERVYTPSIQDFVQDTILPLFQWYKIPTDFPNFEFSRNFDTPPKHLVDFPFSVAPIPGDGYRSEISDLFDHRGEADVTTGIFSTPSRTVPGYRKEDEKTDLVHNPDQYYFDGASEEEWKLPKNPVLFPPPKKLGDKQVKEIVIKNATVGNIALQFMGCKRLESLILENIRWTAATQIKTDLPALKVYHYFESLSADRMTSLSRGKIKDILFFCKDGFQNFWERGIDLIISLHFQLNVILNHKLGEVTLQNVEGAAELLANLGVEAGSLNLNCCHIPHTLLPSHLTSLNIRYVDGIQFADLVSPPNRFPNLKNLYYEAHRDNVQDLDMGQIPGNLENILIGGMSVISLGNVRCKNLSFSDCTFSSEFFQTYPKLLTVEKLVFFGGPTRTPDAEEVSSLVEDTTSLVWVAFVLFDPSDEYRIVFDRATKQKWKIPIESDEQREKFRKIVTWLKSKCDENLSNLREFILQRNTVQDEWKCMEYKIPHLIVDTISGRGKLSID